MTGSHQAVPVPADALESLRRERDTLLAERAWMLANVTYLEHRVDGKEPKDVMRGGYWPQHSDDSSGAFDPALIELDLDEYLQAVVPKAREWQPYLPDPDPETRP